MFRGHLRVPSGQQQLFRGLFEHGPIFPTRPQSLIPPPAFSRKKASPSSNVQLKRSFHTSRPCPLRVETLNASTATAEQEKRLSPSNFAYGLAAAYCGKAHKFNSRTQHYSLDPSTLRKHTSGKVTNTSADEARRYGGQDSSFIASIGNTGRVGFGVTDGVGGWIEQNIDSADFAHGLCESMDRACTTYPPGSRLLNWSGSSPKELLQVGYDVVSANESIKGGGSTACLGIAGPDGVLKTANLGDSGYIHIRSRQVLHVSEHQTHAFNTPYQLSLIPTRVSLQIQRFGGNVPLSDTPKDAATLQHTLQHGDIVVFATDGVWDNLTSQELLEVVSEKMAVYGAWLIDSNSGAVRPGPGFRQLTREPPMSGHERTLQTAIAVAVVERAKAASMNTRRESPFSRSIQRHFPGERHIGGKVDDICAVALIALDHRAK